MKSIQGAVLEMSLRGRGMCMAGDPPPGPWSAALCDQDDTAHVSFLGHFQQLQLVHTGDEIRGGIPIVLRPAIPSGGAPTPLHHDEDRLIAEMYETSPGESSAGGIFGCC